MAKPIKPNIVAAFQRIGTSNGTQVPSKNNLTALLHEYYVASTLFKLAEPRVELAKQRVISAAIEGGFNPSKVGPGDTEAVISDNPDYYLSLKVNNPPIKVNITKFESELIKLGVPKEAVDIALINASEEGTAAKTYTITQR